MLGAILSVTTQTTRSSTTAAAQEVALQVARRPQEICALEPTACDGGGLALTTLALGSRGLTGTIATELGQLTSLETLDLSSNGLSGSIPTELGLMGPGLRALIVRGNFLSGVIPSELGLLTKIQSLHLQGNTLSGAIPSELGKLQPISCYLLERQWGLAATADSNHFACPPPSLPISCAQGGLSYMGRDAHTPGICGTAAALKYAANLDENTQPET